MHKYNIVIKILKAEANDFNIHKSITMFSRSYAVENDNRVCAIKRNHDVRIDGSIK